MKKYSLIAVILLLPLAVNAEALFEGSIDPGYFVGPYTQVTAINRTSTALMGFEGAFLANSRWYFGLAGAMALTEPQILTGLIPDSTEYTRDSTGLILDSTVFHVDSLKNLRIYLAGVKIGYISNPSMLIHWTASALIGGGGITFYTRDEMIIPDTEHPTIKDKFFFIEPEFGAEVNITNSLKFSGSASYRWIAWLNKNYGIGAGELSGIGLKFSLRYGRMTPKPLSKKQN